MPRGRAPRWGPRREAVGRYTLAVKRAVTLLVGTAIALSAGCAAFAIHAREQRLQAELDEVTYALGIEELWPAARALLGERGVALAGEDAAAVGQERAGLLELLSRARETEATPDGGRRLETGWDGRRVRYVVVATPAGAGWRVRYTAIQEHLTDRGHDGYARRAPDLELALLTRIDPAQAAAIVARLEGPPGSGPPPR